MKNRLWIVIGVVIVLGAVLFFMRGSKDDASLGAVEAEAPAEVKEGFDETGGEAGLRPLPAGGFTGVPQSARPEATTAQDIALIYYKYAGGAPNFEGWAQASEPYKAAPDVQKLDIQDRMVKQMTDMFSLLSPGQVIIVDYQAELSDYNLNNKGYFIDNLKENLFFPYEYIGQHFALVPAAIMERQWLPVEDLAAAKAIDDVRKKSADGKGVTMTFFMTVMRAGKDVVTIDNVSYLPLAVQIKGMAVYDAAGKAVWQTDIGEKPNATQKQLMEMKKE